MSSVNAFSSLLPFLTYFSAIVANTTYNPGTTITPNIVPNNIPPADAEPIVLLPKAPAPEATSKELALQ